jgi:hypothetical protein
MIILLISVFTTKKNKTNKKGISIYLFTYDKIDDLKNSHRGYFIKLAKKITELDSLCFY